MIAPANTGSERRRRTAVIRTAHTNNGIRSNRRAVHRMLITVVIKLRAPKIEDTPAKCKEKIAKSTDGPAWAIFLERGG